MGFMKDDGTLSLLDKKMDDLRKHFLDAASSASNRNKEQCGTRLLATKESLGFLISFDLANEDSDAKIKFPNGEIITSCDKEVKKNLNMAVIKACLDNKMKKKAMLLRSFAKDNVPLSSSHEKMHELRKHFLNTALPLAQNRYKKQSVNHLSTTKENLIFRISFDPANGEIETKIKFPNGKTVTSYNEEVQKHLIRALIKTCLDNKMKKKAMLLRSFVKDNATLSLDEKRDELQKHFLDVASSSAPNRNKKQSSRLRKKLAVTRSNEVVDFETVDDFVNVH